MSNDEDAEAGDIAACQFESQEGKYIAILKLDYFNTYNHFIKGEEPLTVSIVRNKTGLPGLSQKVQKSVFIKEIKEDNEYDMLIIDKKPDLRTGRQRQSIKPLWSAKASASLRCQLTGSGLKRN